MTANGLPYPMLIGELFRVYASATILIICMAVGGHPWKICTKKMFLYTGSYKDLVISSGLMLVSTTSTLPAYIDTSYDNNFTNDKSPFRLRPLGTSSRLVQ